MPRPDTPDITNPDGTTSWTLKRSCNGCGRTLGDVTEQELNDAVSGYPLSDVRDECGCTTTPEPDTAANYANANNNTGLARNRDIATDVVGRLMSGLNVEDDQYRRDVDRERHIDYLTGLLNAADAAGLQFLVALAPLDKPADS